VRECRLYANEDNDRKRARRARRAHCRPAIPGLDSIPWLDNARAMQLPKLPDHLVVLGGGYIGCEFAQMFRRFGSKVSLVQRAKWCTRPSQRDCKLRS
jgi:pyruvate/2-oxoglutarate dehydrogenase complex dihydrolipoamide dehydrogenase (E3) component